MLHIISLGAGVQSSTVALMAAHGEITPMPECAIFADTHAEPQHIYDYLDYLDELLPFPIIKVSGGDMRQMIVDSCGDNKGNARLATAPFFVKTEKAKEGRVRRQCTREFKVTPIERKLRELVGLKKGERAPRGEILAQQWIGISMDEITRMKDARIKWAKHRWPLIELKMTRLHCLKWMKEHGYKQPAKSACTFCPYRSDKDWFKMKNEDPVSFADAVAIDNHIRAGASGMKEGNELYIHRSLKPLEEVDLQHLSNTAQFDMFEEECDGMCGV